MQYIQQLFEMSPTWQAVAVGVLLGLVLLGTAVVLMQPAPAMHYEKINGKWEPVGELENDNDTAFGIGAQSAEDPKVIDLNSVRSRNMYPEGQITGDVAWNVQRALDLNTPNSFAFNTGNDDDAA